MTLIEVRDLERRFVIRRKTGRFVRSRDEVVAVRDLTFEIEAGEMVGYIGPNGAGKSTTMRLLTAQAVADEGTIEVLGLEVARLVRWPLETGGDGELHLEPGVGHQETPAMRRAVMAFLVDALRSGR